MSKGMRSARAARPGGSHQLVGGTVCDIARFQQQTGASCVIAGF